MKAKAKIMVSILAGMGLLYGCRSTFPVTTATYTIRKESVDLANGKNLAFNVCGPCHYDYHINSFIGKEMRDLPGFMGRVYSANLTHGHILSQYNDAELFYLIKTGIAHNGRYIPYMIRPTIADQDLNNIIAYFRSNDDPVEGNDSMAGTTRLSFLGKLAGKIMSKPQGYRTGTPQPPTDPVSQGRYLVDIAGCFHCHSKSILGLNYGNPEDSKGYMAGGMKFNIDGQKVFASNLTPDHTGIGGYTAQSFRKALRDGITPGGRELRYPMPRFKRLTDEQSDAIFAYLKTLEPVVHHVRGH